MVRKILIILALCLLPLRAFAADFTATIDNNEVTAGEGFTLELTLSGTEAKADPDLAALAQSFTIAGQGQTSSTSIINGKVSSSIGWDLTLIPKKAGALTIPPVTIQTADGLLSTQPITLNAGQGTAAAPGAPGGGGQVTVSAAADPADPYKNQPIHYAVRVIAHAGVTDLGIDDINVGNAIVDKPDKPKISDEVRNGVPVKVVEYDYLITPLQSGVIVIPPAVVHGDAEVAARMPNGFDNSYFADPFHMMRNMNNFPGFAAAQPFSASSNEVRLNVKPPAAAINPWLPLYSLQIKDEWGGLQNARMGEPLTRKVMLLAEGAAGNALPGLESEQDHNDFKVYADKAATGNDTGKTGERVIGWRTENYTLIPQKSGRLVIPAIKVAWWDIVRNQVAYAELPEKTIDVLPGAVSAAPSAPVVQPQPAAAPAPKASLPAAPGASVNDPVFYAIIGVLLAALAVTGFWALRLKRKISGFSAHGQAQAAAVSGGAAKTGAAFIDVSALETARTPDDLKKFLQDYSARHWQTAGNVPLEKIFSGVPAGLWQDAQDIIKDLTAALYAGRAVDIEALKKRVRAILSATGRKDPVVKEAKKLPELNPR